MTIQERSTTSLALRHLVVYPLAGCAAATWLFAAVVRPILPWESWLLDAATVVCGAVGILIGGVGGFLRAVGSRTHHPAASFARALVPASAVLFITTVLTGIPAHPVALAGVGLLIVFGWLLASASRRRHESR